MKNIILKLLKSRWNLFFIGFVISNTFTAISVTILVTIWGLGILLQLLHIVDAEMTKRAIKRIETKKTTLPFYETLKLGDEIYPGAEVIKIGHPYSHPEVTLKFFPAYGSPFICNETRSYQVGQSFRFKDSPWLVTVTEIDVINQEVKIHCQ